MPWRGVTLKAFESRFKSTRSNLSGSSSARTSLAPVTLKVTERSAAMASKCARRASHQSRSVRLEIGEIELTCLETRDVEQVVHVLAQRAGAARDDAQVAPLIEREVVLIQEALGRREDEGERRTKLVAHVRDRARLREVGFAPCFADLGELLDAALELPHPLAPGLARLLELGGTSEKPGEGERADDRSERGQETQHGDARLHRSVVRERGDEAECGGAREKGDQREHRPSIRVLASARGEVQQGERDGERRGPEQGVRGNVDEASEAFDVESDDK